MHSKDGPGTPPEERKGVKAAGPRRLITVALVIWMLMAAGGYWAAKEYIDRSVASVQQINSVYVHTLQNRLDSMAAEIDQIQLTLSNAGETLASSGSTQENLNQKIQQLDHQLQLLAQSLAVLKEAP